MAKKYGVKTAKTPGMSKRKSSRAASTKRAGSKRGRGRKPSSGGGR